jgi:RNA recognition motif-containing protein
MSTLACSRATTTSKANQNSSEFSDSSGLSTGGWDTDDEFFSSSGDNSISLGSDCGGPAFATAVAVAEEVLSSPALIDHTVLHARIDAFGDDGMVYCPSSLSADDPTRTTVIMKNIPSSYTGDHVLSFLDAMGAWALYDFVYVPVDFATCASFGYAIVNFVSHAYALHFGNRMSGHFFQDDEECTPDTVLTVEWSSQLQGLESHIQRYRNSPMMHPTLPDQLKPMLFSGGRRVCFPAPTKRLKMPRHGSRTAKGLPETPNPLPIQAQAQVTSQPSMWRLKRPR